MHTDLTLPSQLDKSLLSKKYEKDMKLSPPNF